MAFFDRKAIRQALFERLQNQVEDVRFWGTRYMDFDRIPVKPAMTLVVDSQAPTITPGFPIVWTIRLILAIHIQPSADPNDSPDDQADDLLAQVEAALRRQPEEDGSSGRAETTLGGLCQRCSISGEISYWDAGSNGAQVVDVPIEIVALAPPA